MPTPAAAAPVASTPAPATSAGGSAKPNGAAPVKPNPVGGKPAGGQTQQNAAPPAQPTTPQKVKWIDKIDGKDQEFEATEEELRASFRMRSAADRRFEESARQRKEAAAERERAEQTMAKIADRKQVLKAFQEANPDVDMTEFLANELQTLLAEQEQLQDPNIRERRRLEQENQQFRDKEKTAAEQAAQQQREQETQQHTERWATLFKEAIETTKLPINDLTLKMMAEAQYTARQKGWDLTAPQLAESMQKGVNELIESVLGGEGTSDEQILNAFPKLTQRIHRGIVARFKAKQAGKTAQRPADLTPREKRPGQGEEKPAGPRTVTSAEEHKAYGIKGLRTI